MQQKAERCSFMLWAPEVLSMKTFQEHAGPILALSTKPTCCIIRLQIFHARCLINCGEVTIKNLDPNRMFGQIRRAMREGAMKSTIKHAVVSMICGARMKFGKRNVVR